MHTSAKACLSWLSVVGRWRNDVIVAMAMPAIVHALHCSVAQRNRLLPLAASPNIVKLGKQSLYPDGDPDRHQNLIICSLIHCQPFLKISCKSVGTFSPKVANRQTDKQRRKQNLLGGGKYIRRLTWSQSWCDDLYRVFGTEYSATTYVHFCWQNSSVELSNL